MKVNLDFLVTKCFCCIPLSIGLIIWGYIRVVILLLTMLQLKLHHLAQDDIVLHVAYRAPQLLEMGFTVMLIFAIRRKYSLLLQVFYFYCITMIWVYTMVLVLTAWYLERFRMLYHMIFQYAWFTRLKYFDYICYGIIIVVLQVYVTLLVKAELQSFKNRPKDDLDFDNLIVNQRNCRNTHNT